MDELIRDILEFYKDEKNRKEFEKWLQARKEGKKHE